MNKKFFVIILKYIVSVEKIDQARPEHLKFLDHYYDKKVFLFSGRQNPVSGGVIMARGESKEELQSIMDQDPFMTQKLATYKIYEFTPTKYISDFKNIFEV